MTYCSVQDLESYFLNKSFKCGDYLSNGIAKGFILEDAALINGVLKTRYTLPITDADDLMILKSINERLTVGTIDDIFRERTEEGTFDRGRNTRKDAMETLTKIKTGELLLNTAGKASVIKFNSITSDGVEVQKKFKDSNINKY